MAKHIFDCIDAHTCGNPVRLVRSGAPELIGENMMDKREHFIKDYYWILKSLMFEPRGHDLMSGGFLYEPKNDEFRGRGGVRRVKGEVGGGGRVA